MSCSIAQLVAPEHAAAPEHAVEDDLGSGQCAQVLDSATLVLAFDVARLVLVPAFLALAWLHCGESPGVGEP